jgi:hypothetical protein
MSSVIRGIAVAAILTVTFSASAGLGPNGLGPNGLGPNGLGPNGLGPNGLGPNGLGPNGLGPNGLGPNGLGPNGLGPNGLGPNGLDVNGLGPNGLGPNGLGPNGLFVISPPGIQLDASGVAVRDGNGNLVPVASNFSKWFDDDPAGAAMYMKYFTRCAYDGATGLAWLDSKGRTWVWTGQYGLAMGSLLSPALEPLDPRYPDGPKVRARMTADEGKWISSCVLAHVNTQGTHQYISLRANPPNVEAQNALALSVGELWSMSDYHGAFFGDLFAATSTGWSPKFSCSQHGDASEAALLDIVLGRSCDSQHCPWNNADGSLNLIWHSGRCADVAHRTGEVMNPLYTAAAFGDVPGGGLLATLHPIFVNGPSVQQFDFPPLPGWSSGRFGGFHVAPGGLFLPGSFQGVEAATSSGIVTPVGSAAFDLDPVNPTPGTSQTVPCNTPGACVRGVSGPYATPAEGWKLIGIRAGQAIEGVLRYTGRVTNTAAGAINVDMVNPVTPVLPAYDPANPEFKKPFTAVIRYSNCRTTPASATLAVSGPTGLQAPIGSEIWPSTIPDGATACASGESFTWLQVYPVYGFVENSGPTFGDRPTLKIKVSGATQGEACTGAKILKGDGETGTCSNLKYTYFDWKHLKVACKEAGESTPICRGDLILDYRGGKWGWFCAYGGKAVSACTGADAPDLDAFAFIPGKPYCMPDGAKSFAGICK